MKEPEVELSSDEPGRPSSRRRRRRRIVAKRRRVLLATLIAAAATAALVVLVVLLHTRALPKGEVLAVVNGREITVQDLKAEARGRNLSFEPASRPALLDAVVSRVLLAQAAQARRLDETPNYPSDKVRADEDTLARALLRRLPPAPPVTPRVVQAFIEAHAASFRDRKRYELLQLRFSAPAALSARLSALSELQAVRVALAAGDITPAESQVEVTGDELPAPLAAALDAVPEGGVIVSQAGPFVTVTQKIAETADPTPEAQAQAQAYQLLMQDQIHQNDSRLVASLRQAAHIIYQVPPSLHRR